MLGLKLDDTLDVVDLDTDTDELTVKHPVELPVPVGEALIVNEVVKDPDTDGVIDKELLMLGLKLDDTLDVVDLDTDTDELTVRHPVELPVPVGEALIVNEVVRDPDTDGVTDKELLMLGLKLDDTLDAPDLDADTDEVTVMHPVELPVTEGEALVVSEVVRDPVAEDEVDGQAVELRVKEEDVLAIKDLDPEVHAETEEVADWLTVKEGDPLGDRVEVGGSREGEGEDV